MLILSRKPGESIVIDGRITVKIMRLEGDVVKIGIEAPANVPVHRQEVYDEIQASNHEALTEPQLALPRLPGKPKPVPALKRNPMLINPDISADTATSLLRPRTDSGTSTPASTSASATTSSQIDPSLQRLTDSSVSVQDADWELKDESSAMESVQSASSHILQHPGSALNAQANQLSNNVLSLLQPAD